MIIRSRRLLVFLAVSCSCAVNLFAQAPASLSDFTNKVLTLRLTNGTATAVSAVRVLPNGSMLVSGYNLVGPTNAAYTSLSANSGLLVLSGSSVTNNFTLTFATATAGLFTNQFRVAGVPQFQTNYG